MTAGPRQERSASVGNLPALRRQEEHRAMISLFPFSRTGRLAGLAFLATLAGRSARGETPAAANRPVAAEPRCAPVARQAGDGDAWDAVVGGKPLRLIPPAVDGMPYAGSCRGIRAMGKGRIQFARPFGGGCLVGITREGGGALELRTGGRTTELVAPATPLAVLQVKDRTLVLDGRGRIFSVESSAAKVLADFGEEPIASGIAADGTLIVATAVPPSEGSTRSARECHERPRYLFRISENGAVERIAP